MSDNPLAAALESVRSQLIPLTDALIAQLEAEADPQSAEWFVHVRYNLERAQSEEDLIMIFIEQLGPTAPLANLAGFTPIARLRLDQLLAKAQEVAFAFSADGEAHYSFLGSTRGAMSKATVVRWDPRVKGRVPCQK